MGLKKAAAGLNKLNQLSKLAFAVGDVRLDDNDCCLEKGELVFVFVTGGGMGKFSRPGGVLTRVVCSCIFLLFASDEDEHVDDDEDFDFFPFVDSALVALTCE